MQGETTAVVKQQGVPIASMSQPIIPTAQEQESQQETFAAQSLQQPLITQASSALQVSSMSASQFSSPTIIPQLTPTIASSSTITSPTIIPTIAIASQFASPTVAIAPPRSVSSRLDVVDIVRDYDTFLLDCDGVLWNGGSEPIDGSARTLRLLRALGKRLAFISNSSGLSRAQFVAKFKRLLDFDAHEHEVFGTGYLAALYLRAQQQLSPISNVYVVGMQGLVDELQGFGFTVFGGPADDNKPMDDKIFAAIPAAHAQSIDALVCGYDPGFNFYKMSFASLCLQLNPKCHFVATNRDQCDKVSDDRNIPVAEGMVAAIEAVSGVKPVNIGKPSPVGLEQIVRRFGIADRRRMIVIGDRLSTDIALAKCAGTASLLVLTGVTKQKDLLHPDNHHIIPDYVAPTLGTLADLLKLHASKL